jgi:hypothetical protein
MSIWKLLAYAEKSLLDFSRLLIRKYTSQHFTLYQIWLYQEDEQARSRSVQRSNILSAPFPKCRGSVIAPATYYSFTFLSCGFEGSNHTVSLSY